MTIRALALTFGVVSPACSPGRNRPLNPRQRRPQALAIVNARVWTGDPTKPWAEAIAASGDQFGRVGTNDEIRKLATGVTPIDAGGRLVVPGFIDTHVHFLEGGFRLASVQLRDAKTRDEFVNRINAFAATVPAGTWITGGDWDHSLWGGELPRARLDRCDDSRTTPCGSTGSTDT